jgi:D-methionine transport system ATP-binding protein
MIIELKNIHKTYQLPNNNTLEALKGIDLSVKRGEIFGVIGESGAGKSTLIRCINLLEAPTNGQVRIDGQDLTQLNAVDLRTARRKIGMIFQHFNLLNSRTVYKNIAFPLELAGLSKDEIAKKIDPLLALTGLTEKRNHYPSQLSGGQKQRVAIARALANEPSILLSDEATSALDPETKHSILQLLKQINAQLGLTIVLITHEMSVIKEICHRLAIIADGKIVEQANVLDFFTHPQTEIGKKFIHRQALRKLPESVQARLSAQQQENRLPLVRISFFGESAETPLITHLVRKFSLQVNILQAQIEKMRDTMVGTMLVELEGEQEDIKQGVAYLHTLDIYTEVIGYVQPAH